MIKILLKIAGKKDFVIDKSVNLYYIIRICFKYGFMLLRGCWLSWLYKNIRFPFFKGKNVHLIVKKKISVGKKTKIHFGTKIDALSTDGVSLGESCVIGENCIIECSGTISNIGKGLKIGNRTSFGRNCFFGSAGGIEIGDDVIAGELVRFHSENHNYSNLNELIKNQGVNRKGIKIGNNCWIGAGVTFLDGSSIGNGCVVGANALVTKNFPDNVVIGGVPAKILKERC